MQRILFIAANEGVPWGGSEFCWSDVAEKLARQNVQVCVSVKDWGTPVKQIEHLKSVGCKIVYRRPLPRIERLLNRFFPRNYHVEHLRAHACGTDLIVISQGGNTDGYPWMDAAKLGRYKYVSISQNATEIWWPDDEFAGRLAMVYDGAARAYFVSEANLDLTRNELSTPLKNGRVIKNPFNVRYDAQPPWPVLSPLSLACVSRLDVTQKAQDLLIKVLSLPHWRERNLQVSLVGSGPHERSLRKMAENVRLTNLTFSGFVGDIENLWSKHHALVLPSRHEGLPLALVEAFLCGRPAIVTDVGGNGELVRDGVNGFVANAATVESIDEAMNRAWNSRDRLMEMGRRAAKDVRQWVSADPSVDLIRDLMALASPEGTEVQTSVAAPASLSPRLGA